MMYGKSYTHQLISDRTIVASTGTNAYGFMGEQQFGEAIADNNSICEISNCTFSENYTLSDLGSGDVVYNTSDSNSIISNSILLFSYPQKADLENKDDSSGDSDI